ncbi:hypothetical protein BJ742DRAFT_324250 [Cladochytrium replicatum]|nr:hypothetical protein BJ742DRAFT_324250 [Cladochytrium replicatum]
MLPSQQQNAPSSSSTSTPVTIRAPRFSPASIDEHHSPRPGSSVSIYPYPYTLPAPIGSPPNSKLSQSPFALTLKKSIDRMRASTSSLDQQHRSKHIHTPEPTDSSHHIATHTSPDPSSPASPDTDRNDDDSSPLLDEEDEDQNADRVRTQAIVLSFLGISLLAMITVTVIYGPLTLFQMIVDWMESIPYPVAASIAAFSYAPLLVLLFPKSVLSALVGFFFKYPGALLIDMAGTAIGIGSVLLVGHFVLAPYFFATWGETLDEAEPVSQDTKSYGTLATPEASEQKPEPKWITATKNRLRMARKMQARYGGWKVALLLNLSPAIPVHILAYFISLIGVPFFHAFFPILACNVPYSFLYVLVGASAKSLADVLDPETDPAEAWRQAGLFVLGLAASIGIAVWLARVSERLAREVDKEELSITRAEDEEEGLATSVETPVEDATETRGT